MREAPSLSRPDRPGLGPIARNRRRRQLWALIFLALADALLWVALG